MQKVQSTHIERRVDSHATATLGEAFRELHAAVTVMETSIDMRRANLDEVACPYELSGGRENAHRHGGGVAP
jgi:hypothetical protein